MPHVDEAQRRLAEHMRERGLKHTRQRDEILEAFFEAGGHVSIDDLLARVQSRMAGVGYATVYRAMKLFAAAVRVDPQIRYLRRAANCALAAEQPKSAVEYAKKAHAIAPNDPSSARLLAAAFRAAGKLSDAEEVLVMAMALKSENAVLGAELRNDLAEVRRLLATAGRV